MQRIPEELKDVLVSTTDTVSGAIRFAGTRVMLEVFLDNVAAGYSIDEILKSYPTLPREGALAVLEYQNNVTRDIFGLTQAA